MKKLGFDVKLNLKKPPRVYVKSPDKKITFGSFIADEPSEFDGWEKLNIEQKIELDQYIHNLMAVKNHFGGIMLNEQTDFRLRLPLSFIDGINEISLLCEKAAVELDLFEPILASMIQQLKVVTLRLPGEHKTKLLSILDKLGLAEYKKIDFTNQIQAIFSEVIVIPSKSERLHEKAIDFFSKDKSYSPKAIESMARGETTPSKWLVACAVDLLAEKKPAIVKAILSEDDLFMLWAKPLLDHNKSELLSQLIKRHSYNNLNELNDKVAKYYSSKFL